jgi:alpha-beta hydrolase superfamily lysophospholipase
LVLTTAVWQGAGPRSAQADEKPAAPEEVTLEYKDGLQLKATYFAGTKGKESVPIIILHGWKESRKEYVDLARYLQTQMGHAVFLPDMRGHGESTKIKHMGQRDEIVDAAKFRQADFEMLVTDVEKMKQFLMEKNNAQALNISKLCVVGSELGATIAVKWAQSDWSWPELAGRKQGQDVKALFLISPEANYKGLNVIKDFDDPNIHGELSIFIMAGKNGQAGRDSERIYTKLKAYHPDPAKEDVAEKRDLFLWEFDTALQGAKIFGVNPLKGHDMDKVFGGKTDITVDYRQLVAGFIDLRLVKKDFRWELRKLPGQE